MAGIHEARANGECVKLGLIPSEIRYAARNDESRTWRIEITDVASGVRKVGYLVR